MTEAVMVANDLDIYDRCATDWWQPKLRTFRSLHSVAAFHLDELTTWFGPDLAGQNVVDLGCGGGILAVPLAARGARVVGVDRSTASLDAAAAEAMRRGLTCRFVAADVRATGLDPGRADLVVLSDVLEHVEEPAAVIAEIARLLRTGGRAYVNTINRTRRARWLAIGVAETLGYVPRGTHDARLFVRPDELATFAAAAGLAVVAWRGAAPRVWRTLRSGALVLRPSASLAVAYSAVLAKEPA